SRVLLNGGFSNPSITLAPGATADVSLQITTSRFAPAGDETVKVEARDANNYFNGADGIAQGHLIVAGPPLEDQQPDPVAYGVVAALTPAVATAGQGTSARYVVRVTNTGSEDDTFYLQVDDLPDGVYANLDQYYVDVAPGAGNFVDVPLTLT